MLLTRPPRELHIRALSRWAPQGGALRWGYASSTTVAGKPSFALDVVGGFVGNSRLEIRSGGSLRVKRE
jgi:hypothetical protein